MNFTLVPETAPFNPEQRAWLNGFLSGWLGMQEAAGAVAGGFAGVAPLRSPARTHLRPPKSRTSPGTTPRCRWPIG